MPSSAVPTLRTSRSVGQPYRGGATEGRPTTTKKAAPPFVIFERWAPQTPP